MRENLVAHFHPRRDENYTYRELLHLRAAGKEIPNHWIVKARSQEAQEDAQLTEQQQIRADMQAAEKAHAAELKAKDERVLPALRAHADNLQELNQVAAEKQRDATAAINEYKQAYAAAARVYGTIARTIREEYPSYKKDNDGNALPGQTFIEFMGTPHLQGVEIPRPYAYQGWK